MESRGMVDFDPPSLNVISQDTPIIHPLSPAKLTPIPVKGNVR